MILERIQLENAFAFVLNGVVALDENVAVKWREKGANVQKHSWSGRVFWDGKIVALPASELQLVQSNDNLASFVVVDKTGNQLLEKSLSSRSKHAIRKESNSAFAHRAYNAFGQALCILDNKSQVMTYEQFKPIFESEYPLDEIWDALSAHGIFIVEVLPNQYVKI